MSKTIARHCWCSEGTLSLFSDDYAICNVCKTLVSQKGLSDDSLHVKNDDEDFYGKNYWLSHQSEDLTQPDIFQRARDDLSERCLHWLETLLKYRLPTPSARVLELGCAHGGFVAMMRTLGYDAMGLELSPWIVDFARKSFDIPVVLGDIATQNFEPNSFDVIALMDVFEHLPNPKETISHCLKALKPEGILLIQTPSYPVGMSHDDLKKDDHIFLLQLKTDEHLYLFNPDAAQTFFKEFGLDHIAFEPAIFYQYDMFFVASRSPLTTHSTEAIEKVLNASTQGKITLSMLDARKHLQIIEKDRAVRLDNINTLTHLLEVSQKEKVLLETTQTENLGQIDALTQRCQKAENNCKALEDNQKAHLTQIETLTKRSQDNEQKYKNVDEHRQTLLVQMNELTQRCQKAENKTKAFEDDRKTLVAQIETLKQRCTKAESNTKTFEDDRINHIEQIHYLTKQLDISEKDRAARLKVIESLKQMLNSGHPVPQPVE